MPIDRRESQTRSGPQGTPRLHWEWEQWERLSKELSTHTNEWTTVSVWVRVRVLITGHTYWSKLMMLTRTLNEAQRSDDFTISLRSFSFLHCLALLSSASAAAASSSSSSSCSTVALALKSFLALETGWTIFVSDLGIQNISQVRVSHICMAPESSWGEVIDFEWAASATISTSSSRYR